MTWGSCRWLLRLYACTCCLPARCFASDSDHNVWLHRSRVTMTTKSLLKGRRCARDSGREALCLFPSEHTSAFPRLHMPCRKRRSCRAWMTCTRAGRTNVEIHSKAAQSFLLPSAQLSRSLQSWQMMALISWQVDGVSRQHLNSCQFTASRSDLPRHATRAK